MESETFDAIVVGSGISGGWAAKELCERGLKVLLLERGKQVRHGADYAGEGSRPWDLAFGTDSIHPDELAKDYSVQGRNRNLKASTKEFFVNDRLHPYMQDTPFSWIRGYHVGGRSLTWGRQCYRLSDLDFEANLRDGHGIDWPIRYRDIEPWYSYVEKFIGVSGSTENIPHLPDGVFQPGMRLNCVEEFLKQKIESQFDDRKLVIGRCAHLTEPTEEQAGLGRSKCQYRNECARGCTFGSYFSSQSSTLPAAERTGNLAMLTNQIVSRILYDRHRERATGVRVIDSRTGSHSFHRAKVIFLCASTIASTQILLNSRCDYFPAGMANSSGTLGCFLMDHVSKIGSTGIVPNFRNRMEYGRRPTGFYISRFRNLTGAAPGFSRGYAYQGRAFRETWRAQRDSNAIGRDLKNAIRRGGDWRVVLVGFGEMLPYVENTIKLDPTRKDRWDIPLVEVKCQFGGNEERLADDMKRAAIEMLEACGLENVRGFDEEAYPGETVHEMGTARMGHDPKTAVLNSFNQCHDVPNVFVTDGSAMSSSACQNPSLTYMALTARAVDYCVSQVRSGQL